MSLSQTPEFKNIAEKLIEKFPIAFGHIDIDKVLFLKETEKTPKKYADVRSIKEPYTFMTEYKFIIRFYEQVMAGMTDAQKTMTVYHELLHIDPDFTKIKKHNIEDFRELVSKYGVNWDIDPNLPNILDNDEDGPKQEDLTSDDALAEEDEPEIL
ncbi:MAG: putative metallopeptidase [archaeon]